MEKDKSTQNKHTEYNGEYSQIRKALHNRIIECMVEGIYPPIGSPDAVLLGGGSNAGKSTLAELLITDENFVLVDPDNIKPHLPEYEYYQQKEPSLAAQYVHDESSDISAMLLDESINKNLAIVYDGTMKNIQKYERIIKKLKRNQYTVTMIIADISVDKAIERNKVRYEKTGRMVPESDLIESHKAIPYSFTALKDVVDEYYIYNTSGDQPILVAKRDETCETIHHQQYYDEFLRKVK
ncbi:zeta toxin family protein [Salipaludibacillus agaradhaerens]|jgi:predicted ABC-type ATPase|uniref:zeta toxin family protein n=1 Tax=Salipaludibacillus agaradhaerens TaxID=76935 RepID=UPI0021518144|nr:zeta toxin family protein [Salipaludibacillus agaradhaerens]MCR6108728.1 zeta toxin family protein [Salipaludibacillus agaradhaerens]MCR6120751.1 zeta toxin family protein [Salipaludibacillus agaradhaerens]